MTFFFPCLFSDVVTGEKKKHTGSEPGQSLCKKQTEQTRKEVCIIQKYFQQILHCFYVIHVLLLEEQEVQWYGN